jgi:hypothetical protein
VARYFLKSGKQAIFIAAALAHKAVDWPADKAKAT